MGMIDRLMGMGSTVAAVGSAATGMAEILTPNATRRMELDEEAYARAIAEQQAEFSAVSVHWFDAAVNGLNRLPRPLLTLGTIGLFVYAMVEPAGFSTRMEGLALVPEPLWWLMGAIVSFYFGAREAHYFRSRVWPKATVRAKVVGRASEDWRAPVIGQEDEDQCRAPALTGGGQGSGSVVAEMEQNLDGGEAASILSPAQDAADGFADNAALRDWAAARQGAQ